MKASLSLLTLVTVCGTLIPSARAFEYAVGYAQGTQQWTGGATTWVENPANGADPGTFPDAEGDVALFQASSIYGGTALGTANRTVNLHHTDTNPLNPLEITVGQINFNLDVSGNLNRHIISSTGGGISRLIMDGAGSTNSQINVSNIQFVTPANLVGLNDINAPMQLNDQLQLTINNTSGRNDHFNIRIRGLVNGSGGITKLGPVNTLLIWPTPNAGGGLQYTGPTYLGDPGGVVGGTYGTGGGGRNQFVPASANGPSTPTHSSAFYVVGNAQLGMFADGTFQFGAATAPLVFNSDGMGSAGIGALRPERLGTPLNRASRVTITNSNVILAGSNTIWHSEDFDAHAFDPSHGYIQFTGTIRGGPTNKLQLTTTSHSANQGSYVLSGTNAFEGGIDLYSGRLSTDINIIDGGVFNPTTATAYPNATFGLGDVHAIATGGVGHSRVTIPMGVRNAIDDWATLTLDAGGNAFAELGQDIVENVGMLVLGGVNAIVGDTYGSTASGAIHQDDSYFKGTGMIYVGGLDQPGEFGDFNDDGNVNLADYVTYRGASSHGYNDVTYARRFRENFGTGPNPGPSLDGPSAVPEPSTFALVGLCVSLMCASRRRRPA